MLIPESTASDSIASSSSCESSRLSSDREVVVELGHAAGADQHRGDPLVAQHPRQRQLGQRLAAAVRDLVEPADVRDRLVGEQRRGPATCPGRPATPRGSRRGTGRSACPAPAGENAMQPTPSSPSTSSSEGSPSSTQRLSIEYDGWWISSGTPISRSSAAASRVCLGAVGRDAGVDGPPGLHRRGQRAHRLLERRLRVEAVAVEDVDVVEAHPGQALVERAEEVLARPPLAVRPRPHVVAGLGRDHQLVAVGPEVLGEDRAEVRLRRAVRRPVVVGQVEVGHAPVERPAQDRPLGLDRLVVAEVVPQAERDRRQLQPRPAAAAVGVALRNGRRRRGTAQAWSPSMSS